MAFDSERLIPMFADSEPAPANPTGGGGVDNEPPDAAEEEEEAVPSK